MSDDVWLDRLREGDEAAFRLLFESRQRRVYALASRLVDTDAAAADVTQNTFIEAWRVMRSFRGDSTVDTWLHGICVSISRNYWRSETRRKRREQAFAVERKATPLMVQVAGADNAIAMDVEAALRELPPRIRAAVTLTCIEGHSYATAARLMGSAEGTIKAQVHRGRQILRERLER